MTTVEKITRHVQHLPEVSQQEVLDFIEFLTAKVVNGRAHQLDEQWSMFSLAQAMRDMEDEVCPSYYESDLKERWV